MYASMHRRFLATALALLLAACGAAGADDPGGPASPTSSPHPATAAEPDLIAVPGYRYRDLDTQDSEACGAMVALLAQAGDQSVQPVAGRALPTAGVFVRTSCHYVVDADAPADQVGIIEFQIPEPEASSAAEAEAFARQAVPAMVAALTETTQVVAIRDIAGLRVSVALGGERNGELTTLGYFVNPVVYLVFGDRPGPPSTFVDALIASSGRARLGVLGSG